MAYYMEADSFVFLKDSWTARGGSGHPELETYARLKEHGVEHVATAIAGGEVGGPDVQLTHSQQYATLKRPPLARVHYRLVTNIGRPLESYTDSQELLRAVHCAFEGTVDLSFTDAVHSDPLTGHKQAYEKAGILHGDVSVANILIDVNSTPNNFKAFLNDWDACAHMSGSCMGSKRLNHTVSFSLVSL